MITSRPLNEEDYPLLEQSLETGLHHKGTKLDFFLQPGTLTNVYENDGKPVLFVRGSKALRLDLDFISDTDFEVNRLVMLEGFPLLAVAAKENGFSEVVFNSSSPLLKRFCCRQLGFQVVEGNELRRIL